MSTKQKLRTKEFEAVVAAGSVAAAADEGTLTVSPEGQGPFPST